MSDQGERRNPAYLAQSGTTSTTRGGGIAQPRAVSGAYSVNANGFEPRRFSRLARVVNT